MSAGRSLALAALALAASAAPVARAGAQAPTRPGLGCQRAGSRASATPFGTRWPAWGIPGLSLAVVDGGVVRLQEAHGFADVENGVPARPESVYRLASVSKPMTAVAVLHLYERRLIDLDAPVWRYCPEFPEKPWPVTARQLLCHQGGVRHYRPEEPTLTRRFETSAESLALFRDDPLLHEPGTQVRYSTFGYNLLGCAAAGAARTPFLELLREAVFGPAEMSSTGADDQRAIVPNRAQGYTRDAEGRLRNSALADMSYKVPGGGLSGTAADVARFGSALGSGRLLSAGVLEQMLTRQTRAGWPPHGVRPGSDARRTGRPEGSLAHRRSGASQHGPVPRPGQGRPSRRTGGRDPREPRGGPA